MGIGEHKIPGGVEERERESKRKVRGGERDNERGARERGATKGERLEGEREGGERERDGRTREKEG